MKSYYRPGNRSSDQLKVSDQILDEEKEKGKKLFCNGSQHFPVRKLRRVFDDIDENVLRQRP